jgi:hypothetical protein
MIPLDAVGTTGTLVPTMDFPGGQHPFGESSLPDRITQAPGQSAVLVANPADRTIYFYSEGMAAPMGHFTNYSRQPRAVLVVDRSLRERRTGEYETTAQLGRAGRYTLALFVNSPRVVHCFEDIVLHPLQSRSHRPPVTLQPLSPARAIRVGETVRLRFRASDTATGSPKSGIEDLMIQVYRASGIRPVREFAKAEPDGVYYIDFTPDDPGAYVFVARSGALGLDFGAAPPGRLEVGEKEDR